MAQTIKLKRSSTAGAVPSTSDLELGELALNTYDGKIFMKKDDGTAQIIEVGGGGGPSNIDVASNMEVGSWMVQTQLPPSSIDDYYMKLCNIKKDDNDNYGIITLKMESIFANYSCYADVTLYMVTIYGDDYVIAFYPKSSMVNFTPPFENLYVIRLGEFNYDIYLNVDTDFNPVTTAMYSSYNTILTTYTNNFTTNDISSTADYSYQFEYIAKYIDGNEPNKIYLKRSSTDGYVPSPSDLDYGELFLNYKDEKLYYKNNNDQIVSIVEEDSGGSVYAYASLKIEGNSITPLNTKNISAGIKLDTGTYLILMNDEIGIDDYVVVATLGTTASANEDKVIVTEKKQDSFKLIVLNAFEGLRDTQYLNIIVCGSADTECDPTTDTTSRAVFAGGSNGSTYYNTIDYVTISTTGNASDFGDLYYRKENLLTGTSNGLRDRGMFGGGYYDDGSNTYYYDETHYITISSTSDSSFGGNLTLEVDALAATSNGMNDRGIFGGGMDNSGSNINVIQALTISSATDATDFGDLANKVSALAATSNGTNDRGIFGGGYDTSLNRINSIEYITISKKGNASDFGDLQDKRVFHGSTSNGVNDRSVFGGGDTDSELNTNAIEYVTISSTGNASDFGDLTDGRTGLAATSNGKANRGVFGGGSLTIDYITISTPGNASDFGDLTVNRSYLAAASNGNMSDMNVCGPASSLTGYFDYIAHDRAINSYGEQDIDKDTIEYVTISKPSNALIFGTLYYGRYYTASTSNGANDKGAIGGGKGSNSNTSSVYYDYINYTTISTPGNAGVGGYLSESKDFLAATSNGVNDRGIFGGGYDSNAVLNTIEYITISSGGNASDFGDLSDIRSELAASSNGINDRGIFGGGQKSGGAPLNIIEYVTISSTGNASDFGDLTTERKDLSSTSNGIHDRGIFSGGVASYTTIYNVIDYVTISSTGNASDFGDLTVSRAYLASTSSGIHDRGLFFGGQDSNNNTNIIDYVTISSTGDASDFGDLQETMAGPSATSNTGF